MAGTNQITGERYRFTVITDQLIRMEYQTEGHFEDRSTQVVTTRDFGAPNATFIADNGIFAVQIDTPALHLYYRGGPFTGESLFIDYKYNYQTHWSRWHFGDETPGNLLGTTRTLDDANGPVPLGPGILSRDGFAVLDDSQSLIQNETTVEPRAYAAIDLYGFAYGHDYQKALHDYFELTGFPPLIPRFALGNWWSRFYPYTQAEYLHLMDQFEAKKIPIAVAVLDMNWHTTEIPADMGSGWTGYSWDLVKFPHPSKMLADLHRRGLRITLNVHPASGIRASESTYSAVAEAMGIDPQTKTPILFDWQNPRFMRAYFEHVHHVLEDAGVDFWWIDWQQGSARSKTQVDPLWALNVAHYHDQVQRKGENALILSRYSGPGSHRYPIGFSGDTYATWASLDFQPYFTATASNIGYTWWSHDIGGHMRGRYDPELSLRWLQLGVFSPILRLHSSDNPFMGKEPWRYDAIIEAAMTRLLQLRARLVPYLDSANQLTHTAGIPLITPLYYHYPEVKEAYSFQNEYFFGSELLVLPITTPLDATSGLASVTGFVPEGTWTDVDTGQIYQGPAVQTFYRGLTEFPVLARSGAILPLAHDPMTKSEQLPQTLDVHLFGGAVHQYVLHERAAGAESTTTFDWDPVTAEFSVQVEDPQRIIPQTRVFNIWYDHVLIATFSAIQAQSRHKLELTTVPARAAVKLARIQSLIAQAKIDFEQKRQLWEAAQASDPATAASSVLSLSTDTLSYAILEILLHD